MHEEVDLIRDERLKRFAITLEAGDLDGRDAVLLVDAEPLGKRLRGREKIADDVEFRRLFRYLIGQGFEPDRVMALLKKRSPRSG